MKDDDDGGINLFGFLGRIFGEIVKTKLKEVKIVIKTNERGNATSVINEKQSFAKNCKNVDFYTCLQ